ncbi:MAG: histidine phosphatase family protein [Streptosporangiales bacterium]|nr:histidine phosphatase family protein [Streptosporangiales bacterium]MBO0891973.1 histidine phosphatase family protein [Acidothermales bacterium]
MRTLHLVRHGRPFVDADVPANRWPLHPDAASAIACLRASGVLPEHARWFSSPEPKAHRTARLLTDSSVTVYDALGEVTRPGCPDDFAVRARRGFAEPDVPAAPGWETYTAARQRIVRAVRKLRDGLDGADLVVVGHGTVLTLLVAELTGAVPDVAAWEWLGFPDHCALDADAGGVVSPWGRSSPAARPKGPASR